LVAGAVIGAHAGEGADAVLDRPPEDGGAADALLDDHGRAIGAGGSGLAEEVQAVAADIDQLAGSGIAGPIA
jgi:hypothetical protein